MFDDIRPSFLRSQRDRDPELVRSLPGFRA
jgi:hypothetical protein